MAFSPRVKLLGEISDSFPRLVVVVTTAVVALAIVALTSWKLGYEKDQQAIREADRVVASSQTTKRCLYDLECLRQELPSPSKSTDNLAQSFQDETADWTFFLLVLGVLTGGISVLGLIWIRASLLAAREANNLNAAAIITSERGWVFSTVEPLSLWMFEHGGEVSSLNIRIKNKNAGKTAAINVHTNVHSSDLSSVPLVMDLLAAESLRHDGAQNGMLLPPGESYDRDWAWTSHDRFEVDFTGARDFIVICVTYETLFDDRKHQTGIVYAIEPARATGGKPILRPWAGGFAT